jgi:hypothetical protein
MIAFDILRTRSAHNERKLTIPNPILDSPFPIPATATNRRRRRRLHRRRTIRLHRHRMKILARSPKS